MPTDMTEEQARAKRENFEKELDSILKSCKYAGVLARTLGSIAFHTHCPKFGQLQFTKGNAYTDIDLAAYKRDSNQIREIMKMLGYTENREIFVLSEAQRALFYGTKIEAYVNVFYEKLDFCHVIPLANRLHIDTPTIPLAELLLEKMQIVRISEKDLICSLMLLLEHPLGPTDEETINIKYIARLCAQDWGLWHTTTINLNKVNQFAQQYEALTSDQKSTIETQVKDILLRLYTEPKPMAWKVRDHLGERAKWYKDVE